MLPVKIKAWAKHTLRDFHICIDSPATLESYIPADADYCVILQLVKDALEFKKIVEESPEIQKELNKLYAKDCADE